MPEPRKYFLTGRRPDGVESTSSIGGPSNDAVLWETMDVICGTLGLNPENADEIEWTVDQQSVEYQPPPE